MTDTNPGAQGASPVEDLIRQREQLRGWLSKLGEVATGASSKVAERVRQDYEERLRRVTEQLTQFRDEISRDLEALQGDLASAEQRRAQASEVLEEARLRHMIGELDEGEWATQQAALQADVDAAADAAERARAEVDRLSALAADVSGEPAAAEPEPAVEPEPEPVAEAPAEPPAPAEAPAEAPARTEEEEDADVSSWLEQLSAATSEAPAEPAAPAEEPEEESGGDLPWLENVEETAEAWTPDKEVADGLEFLNELEKPAAAEGTETLAEDDLAFLEELDRAISGSPAQGRAPTPPPAAAAPATPSAEPAGDRQSGGPLLCKECGAINEPHSWYCEVCGSEL